MSRYIDAEKLKDEIRKEFPALGDRIAINTIINSQPTADVRENVHGKWVEAGEYLGELRFKCSACQKKMAVSTVMLKPVWNFCPNCGAKMEVPDEEPT